MSPISIFNGDVMLVARGSYGGMYLLMGDFTGHGLTAAMGTLPVAMVFFKMASRGVSIGTIACELNAQLNKLLPPGLFFAATLLELNVHGDMMSVWMGGMPEVYWLDQGGELKGSLQAQHMPLGILENNGFDGSINIINIDDGDKIYLYSDGVTELERPDGVMFGHERLKEQLLNHGDDRFEKVLEALTAFTGQSDQNDDVTLVEMTCHEVPAVITHASNESSDDEYGLPWQVSFPLTASDMRNGDPVRDMCTMLGALPRFNQHKGVLHTVLSEIYANVLEHSILGLETIQKTDEDQFEAYYMQRELLLGKLMDAAINFDFSYTPDINKHCLKICVTDSGRGFEGETHSSGYDQTDDSGDYLHGRGQTIIETFCDQVAYTDGGRTLKVMYRL